MSLSTEIIAIGNEVLAGITVNTNAAEIGQALHQIGVIPSRQVALPDNYEILKQGLKESLDRSELIICTGGLGPTVDDITRNVAAELFHSDFKLDPRLLDELKHRYGNKTVSLEDQATVPVKAKIISNPVGTAPGFIFQENGKTLMLLPGVPQEMRKMLHEQVIPFLKGVIPQEKRAFRKVVCLFEMTESRVDPTLRELQARYPDLLFGIYPNLGLLMITVSTFAASQNEANNKLQVVVDELRKKFESHLFESDNGKIDGAVHHLLMKSGKSLSVAESCTGGALAARLIRNAGASEYMLGSIVAYSNKMKKDVLGVPEDVLKKEGAVSSDTVEWMLKGVMELTGSDYAVAVTGIAGPGGGTPEKPVGTVWCGVAKKDESLYTWNIQGFGGSREMVIERSINAILAKLYKVLNEEYD